MIYLDNAATTFRKPPEVVLAVQRAMQTCASPGRGGYPAAEAAEEAVFRTRTLAARRFGCETEQVCFTKNATEGLNAAIRTLIHPGDRVVISGLEHNAVTRPLQAIGAVTEPVRAPLFDGEAWAAAFSEALARPAAAVICTQVSNVFGSILPVDEIAALCRARGIPLIVDASQSAGLLPVNLRAWQAAFVAMPGHKGLFGPQGTGILLCARKPEPLIFGGTGSQSALQTMPEELPDRLEAGTLNVPGICGLGAGLQWLEGKDPQDLLRRETGQIRKVAEALSALGVRTYHGPAQAGVLSFCLPGRDPVASAEQYAARGIALRAGLHCAPLAHRTAGTLPGGTVRLSVCPLTTEAELQAFLGTTEEFVKNKKGSEKSTCYFPPDGV